jgi:hypothetical protein
MPDKNLDDMEKEMSSIDQNKFISGMELDGQISPASLNNSAMDLEEEI